jgi:hypothetical protein
MKVSKQAKKEVLKLLKNSPKTEHDLQNEIANDLVSDRHVTDAIEKLIQKEKVLQKDGFYFLKKERGEVEEASTEETTVPIAEVLRRRRRHQEKSANNTEMTLAKHENENDIDDEIQRLEAELAADDDDEDYEREMENDSDNDNPSEDLERDRHVSFGAIRVKEIESAPNQTREIPEDSILCLSSVAKDRIAPLPETCLPKTTKRVLKGIDDDPQQKQAKKSKVSAGLRDAVKEVLNGYVARSSERLPFYCRVCAQQYKNEQDFFGHKVNDFHKAAVEVERKASFCKLCRKQFTSPVQLKEHISSRPHKERVGKVRARQKCSNHNGTRQHGGGGDSRRQWC